MCCMAVVVEKELQVDPLFERAGLQRDANSLGTLCAFVGSYCAVELICTYSSNRAVGPIT